MLSKITESARRFTQGHRSLLVPGSEKKWCGTHVNKPDGEWDKTAEGMMLNFAESGHPVFRASSALERGELKAKGKGVNSIHFNCSDATIELILRTVPSISSVSSEQYQICAKNYPETHQVQGNPPSMRIWNQW